jgi:hypothetical protein
MIRGRVPNPISNNSSRNRRRKRKNPAQSNHIVRLNERGRFAPDMMYVTLRFSDTSLTRSAPMSTSVMNWRYRSSAFDPDPLLLSGSIPGFVELANLYNQYRVEKMVAHIELSNQETEAVIVSGWPSNNDNNNNSLAATDVLEYGSNVRGQFKMLSAVSGMSRGSLTIVADLNQLVGPTGFTDLDYSSDTSTNPVVTYFVNFGVVKTSGVFNFGIPTKVDVDYHVCFYKPRQLES